jgi:hypothetical protein
MVALLPAPALALDLTHDESAQNFTHILMTGTTRSFMGDEDDDQFSEMHATFQQAYREMCGPTVPSILEAILSGYQAPQKPIKPPKKMKKSSASPLARRYVSPMTSKSSHRNSRNGEEPVDFDTRAPAYEKKMQYDSILDENCRLIVRNPELKQMLERTRPTAQVLLWQRFLDEGREAIKPAYRIGKKYSQQSRSSSVDSKDPKDGGTESWEDTVRRFTQESTDREGPPTADVQARFAHLPSKTSPDRSEATLQEWAETRYERLTEKKAEGARPVVQSQLHSINGVLMSQDKPATLKALREQLETLWKALSVSEQEMTHTRGLHGRDWMDNANDASLAHMFHHISRWRHYHAQVKETCEVICRREMMLSEIKDAQERAHSCNVALFFEESHRAVQNVTALKAAYPGVHLKSCLLLDYVSKIRNDVKQIGNLDLSLTQNSASASPDGSLPAQPAVKLAAELGT